jgi:hypothetical protein
MKARSLSNIVNLFVVGLIVVSILQPEVCCAQGWVGRLFREAAGTGDDVLRKVPPAPQNPKSKLLPNPNFRDIYSRDAYEGRTSKSSQGISAAIAEMTFTPRQKMASDRVRRIEIESIIRQLQFEKSLRSINGPGMNGVSDAAEKIATTESWISGVVDSVSTVDDLVEILLNDEAQQTLDQAWTRHDAIMKMNQFLDTAVTLYDTWEISNGMRRDAKSQTSGDVRLFQMLVICREWAKTQYSYARDQLSKAESDANIRKNPESEKVSGPCAAWSFAETRGKLTHWIYSQVREYQVTVLRTMVWFSEIGISCFKPEWQQFALMVNAPSSIREEFEVASYDSFDRIRKRQYRGTLNWSDNNDSAIDIQNLIDSTEQVHPGKMLTSTETSSGSWIDVFFGTVVGGLLLAAACFHCLDRYRHFRKRYKNFMERKRRMRR